MINHVIVNSIIPSQNNVMLRPLQNVCKYIFITAVLTTSILSSIESRTGALQLYFCLYGNQLYHKAF